MRLEVVDRSWCPAGCTTCRGSLRWLVLLDLRCRHVVAPMVHCCCLELHTEVASTFSLRSRCTTCMAVGVEACVAVTLSSRCCTDGAFPCAIFSSVLGDLL